MGYKIKKYGVLIRQKYLVAEHTQTACIVLLKQNSYRYLYPKKLCHHTPDCKNQAITKRQPPGVMSEANAEVQFVEWPLEAGSRSDSIPTDPHVKMLNFRA